MKRATKVPVEKPDGQEISIHALVKRATIKQLMITASIPISIHALVKRATTILCQHMYIIKISIHALVKRATSFLHDGCPILCISIHALVKRATFVINSAGFSKRHFNPRPREEGDIIVKRQSYCEQFYFNPRPREEGDIPPCPCSRRLLLFQSTPS